MSWFVVAAVVFLAYSNGSNDNFKGVAALYGSGTTSYKRALAWATATTFAGSMLALVLADGLVKTFSAKGLVPEAVASLPSFLGAAAFAAALTVILATIFGLPVSTTHAITGALVGAGFIAARSDLNLSVLGKSFVLPLLASPLIAMLSAMGLYPLARAARRTLKVERETCVCVGTEWVPVPSASGNVVAGERVTLAIASGAECRQRYNGNVFGLSAQRALDVVHFVSAGAVGFARGLNDTPKIVAILIGANALGANLGLLAIGLAMATGGWLGARKVAETMAHKITQLNAGQGLVASLNTALLVLFASRLGMPVSTTHVSNGALFGIGFVTGRAQWKTIASILLAWLTTLPLAATLGAASYFALRGGR